VEKWKSIIFRIIAKVVAFFYRDFHWKILSLTLAFLLWFVGINVNNPIQTDAYDNLPLMVLHRDHLAQNNVVLLNEQQLNNARVGVSIQATRGDHAIIRAARNDNILASVDLSTINFDQVHEADSTVRVQVDVDVFIHQNHVARAMRPSTIELLLDRHGDLSLPIEVDPIGTPLEGFEKRPAQLVNTMVRLSGAQSILDEVAGVRVRAYIDNAYRTVEEVKPLVVYNRNREDITSSVNLSFQTVHVRVPILPYNDIPLEINATGNPMPGFMVTEVSINPSAVALVGPEEDISNISNIMLGDIDLTLANQNIQQSFEILPAIADTGLTLREGAPEEAVVSVVVERVIARNFSLPLENVTVSGYVRPFTFVSAGPLTVSVRGRESVIGSMTLNQIRANLDLTGLGAGTHTVQLGINVPRFAALANNVTVEVTIEAETIVFEPVEPPDWTADLEDDNDEDEAEMESETEPEEETGIDASDISDIGGEAEGDSADTLDYDYNEVNDEDDEYDDDEYDEDIADEDEVGGGVENDDPEIEENIAYS